MCHVLALPSGPKRAFCRTLWIGCGCICGRGLADRAVGDWGGAAATAAVRVKPAHSTAASLHADVVAVATEGVTSLKHLMSESQRLVAESGANASKALLLAPHGEGWTATVLGRLHSPQT